MVRWMKRAAAGLLAVLIAAFPGSAWSGSVTLAEPADVTSDLQEYVSYYTFLAGTSGNMRVYKDPESTSVNDYLIETEGLPEEKWVGYRIADFDQDGQDELLIVGLTGEQETVKLDMYEWYSGTVMLQTSYQMPDDPLYSLHMPLLAGDGIYSAVMDLFYYTAGGRLYIGVESEAGGYVMADGRSMLFMALSYQNGLFSQAGSAYFAGSDPSYDGGFLQSLANVGISGANWSNLFSQYSLIGNYAPDYHSIARITHTPLLSFDEAAQFLEYGSHMMRWSRIDFSMPWDRKVLHDSNEREIRKLFTGFSSWEDSYFTGSTADWTEDQLLGAAYEMFSLDLINAVSNYSDGGQMIDLAVNNYQYHKAASKENGWYWMDRSQLTLLIRSLVGACPETLQTGEIQYNELMYSDGDYIYIYPMDGPDLQLLVDAVYEENGHRFATGTVYRYDGNHIICQGRFTAGLYGTMSTLFGDYITSLYYSGYPTYVTDLEAEASSFLPEEGEGHDYSPEMVLDGNPASAWNEDVDGYGVGEWIRVSTTGNRVYPITGIQVLSGYQKTDSIYEENGKPSLLSILIDNYFIFDKFVQYDDIVGFGQVNLGHVFEFTIKDVLPGTLYDDTCISEIRFLTANPLAEYPPYGTGSPVPAAAEGYVAIAVPEEEETLPASVPPAGGVAAEYYILPESHLRLYTVEELSSLSSSDLRLARNEIYARHGRRFSSADLQAYFDSMPWYTGTISPEAFDNSILNAIELQNIELITSLE